MEPFSKKSHTPVTEKKTNNGIAKVHENATTTESTFDMAILKEVDQGDHEHMISVIEYCMHEILLKHQTVKDTIIYVFTSKNIDQPDYVSYQLYIGFPPKTVISTKHTDALRTLDRKRISEPISWSHCYKNDKEIIKIPINSLKNNRIRLKKMYMIGIECEYDETHKVYPDSNESKDDDREGSTKRKRGDQ